jgi:hypothetical protein
MFDVFFLGSEIDCLRESGGYPSIVHVCCGPSILIHTLFLHSLCV